MKRYSTSPVPRPVAPVFDILNCGPRNRFVANGKLVHNSGGDGVNWQNMPRGSKLREALMAPPKHKIMVFDQAQIEARLNAYFAGQLDVIEAFRLADAKKGPDVYKYAAATAVYLKPVDSITKDERFVGKTCIAEGALVLTKRGLIQIQNVTLEDRVWDGVEWVRHDGVIYKGVRDVITYQGLTATPDHEVFVEGRTIPFGDAAAQQAVITQTGASWAPIRLGSDYSTYLEAPERVSVRKGALREQRHYEVDQPRQSTRRENDELSPEWEAPASERRGAWAAVRRYYRAVRESVESWVRKLRRSRHTLPVQVSQSFRRMGVESSTTHYVQWCGDRPREQQRQLRAVESTPRYAQGASSEPTEHGNGAATRQTDTCERLDYKPVQQRVDGETSKSGDDCGADSRQSETVSNGKTPRLASHPRKARVYDIINAGPRHRFTVDNLLVLNCVLGLGYGAGAPKFADMLRVGQFGPPMEITDERAAQVVKTWRVNNSRIVAFWKATELAFKQAMREGVVEFGPVAFEAVGDDMYIHMPDGTFMYYEDVQLGERGDISYFSGRKRDKMWGGVLVENIIQGLGRVMIAANILAIKKAVPKIKFASTTHDELIMVHPDRGITTAARTIHRIMTTPPEWAPGIPLNVSSAINERYIKD